MREIHKLSVIDKKYQELQESETPFLVIEDAKYNALDYVLLQRLTADTKSLTGDSILVEITETITDENVKDGFVVAKIKRI